MFTKAALLALGAVAVQAQSNLDCSNTQSQCPSGWSANTLGDDCQVYCCPGSAIQINNDGACCIGIGTMGPRESCSTTVQYSDPNYSSIVSSLAAVTESPNSNSDASMTSMSMDMSMSSDATMTSMDTTMTMSGSGAGAAATSMSSSTSDGAAPGITAGPMFANVLLGAAGAALLL